MILKRDDQEATQSFWDSRALHFNHLADDREQERRALLDKLEAGGFISRESRVLDIGCGPGGYAVPLAERTKWVTGLDVSSKMLQFCQERAEKKGLSNLTLLEMDWRQVDLNTHKWEGAFDFVMASMSPGVHNVETLETFMKVSRKACYISAFVSRNDSLGDALDRHLQLKTGFRDTFPAPFTNKIDYVEHVLQQKGIPFTRNHLSRCWEQSMPLKEAIDHYSKRLRMHHSLSVEQQKEVAAFLTQRAVDDEVKEMTDVIIGEIYWLQSSK